jgi:addiction module RelE/StbE family toxin
MTVRWTPTALRDLQALHAFIASDRKDAAVGMVERILDGIAALEDFPQIGRPGRVVGTRELVVSPYVVAYRLRRGVVELLAIIHGKRRWPEKLG